jgi:hypothetical protein
MPIVVPHRLAAPLWLLVSLLGCAACGTSTVNLMVVRPAVINARPYGDTITVAGFQALRPEFAMPAEALRMDLSQRVIASVGGVVRLMEQGGGLIASGAVLEHGMIYVERTRVARCTETVRHDDNGVITTEQVQQDCPYRRLDWTARVTVHLRVTTPAGQVLYLRRHAADRHGTTQEVRGAAPIPPDSSTILAELRAEVADQMAGVLVPHRERVQTTFYDCDEPAKAACEAGVRLFANSNYDGAVAAFTDAIDKLTRAGTPNDQQAKAWWDRSVVYQFSRRFDLALTDLQKSCQLDPRGACEVQRHSVEHERAVHAQLVDEGLGN